nr:MAG TPA: hypothetical protein [Crassvirales sp.]
MWSNYIFLISEIKLRFFSSNCTSIWQYNFSN